MGFVELYHYYNVEIADKRTTDWPLIGSPVPILLLTFAYLYLVLGYGPRYMKDKEPYTLATLIKFYNLFQIVTNTMVVYYTLDAGWYQDYFIYCIDPDYSTNRNPYKIACIMWWVCMLKICDYVETFIYVLRKKNRQISFLHVYHHVSTVFIIWMGTKYWAHGMSLTVVATNSFIHIIMYTYYLLSNFGSNVRKYLQPVKPIITMLQMVQFVALIMYSIQGFLPYCRHQFCLACIIIVDLMINFVLFYKFYKTSYKSTKSKQK